MAGPIIHGATKDAHPSELVAKARPASAKPTANIEESSANDDPLGEVAEDDPWGEHAKIVYVGVDDEKVFHANLISDAENDHDYIPDTDLENPKIAVGVTFEDGQTFKRAIRQYAILNEIEIAAPYSEATRYRGFCKAKKCKWMIHASQLQDGRTWMVIDLSSYYLVKQLYSDPYFLVIYFSFKHFCRLRRYLTSTTVKAQVNKKEIAWLINFGLGTGWLNG